MKTVFNKLLITVVSPSLFSLVNFASAAEFTLPKYEKMILKNGLTIYLMKQDEVPLVDVVAIVKAGAVGHDNAGVA